MVPSLKSAHWSSTSKGSAHIRTRIFPSASTSRLLKKSPTLSLSDVSVSMVRVSRSARTIGAESTCTGTMGATDGLGLFWEMVEGTPRGRRGVLYYRVLDPPPDRHNPTS